MCLNKGIAIRSLNFSVDCKLLAVADSEGIVRTLQLSENQILTELHNNKIHDGYILKILISKDKRYLISSSSDSLIKVFDIKK